MHVNKNYVSADLTSQSPVDKEGYLCIREDNIHKDFLMRWFVLKGNTLSYFERDGSTEPIGVIVLEGFNIELAEDDNLLFYFKIKLLRDNYIKSYTLGANSQESKDQWVESLKCVKPTVTNSDKTFSKLEVPQMHAVTGCFQRIGIRSHSPSPNFRTYISNLTFKDLHRQFGKPVLKDRNERLRVYKNKSKQV